MNTHPLWSHTLPERLGLLKAGTTRIAYLAPKPEYGTFRYRCFNPVDALNRHSPNISASYFFYSDLEALDNLADYADCLVVSRCPMDAQLDRLFRRFHNSGKKVFFDIDDLVCDTNYATLVASNLGYPLEKADLNNWTAFIASINLSLTRADEVITTNDHLAEQIRTITSSQVHVVRNTFNEAQLRASDEALNLPKTQTRGLTLGYFSGSNSHSRDFDVIAGPLLTFLEETPESSLTVVGHLEIPSEYDRLGSRLIRVPFMDFLQMQSFLRQIDLNIVPLQDSLFTWSKSELKYFEAALVETPTLASNTPVFRSAVTPRVTGFLAESSEWLSTLREIGALAPEKLHAVGAAARASILDVYGPPALADRLSDVLGKRK